MARHPSSKNSFPLLLAPGMLCIAILFMLPLLCVLYLSFLTYSPDVLYTNVFTLGNYAKVFSPAYQNAFVVTFKISGVCTIVATLLGFPFAYTVARSKSKLVRKILLAFTMLAFFVSGIARVFSWMLVLGDYGIINRFVEVLGLPGTEFLGTELAINIGTVHALIPFVILSLIGPIANIDPSTEEAAKSLGANELQTFVTVTLPQCFHGIVSSVVLCFSMGLTVFVIPLVLGAGRIDFLTTIVWARAMESLNWPFAAAMSAILLLLTMIISYGIGKILLSKSRIK